MLYTALFILAFIFASVSHRAGYISVCYAAALVAMYPDENNLWGITIGYIVFVLYAMFRPEASQ